MRSEPLLIVPGYKGSGPGHWQSWLQERTPGAVRVDRIDWDTPILAQWASRIRETLAEAPQPLRVVAHSFGCLAAIVAAADRPGQIADLILVAPADPERFDFAGLRPEHGRAGAATVADALPRRALGVRGCVVASRDDRWLDFRRALQFATDWELDLHDAGNAGHINELTGFGPWPALLDLLERRAAQPPLKPTSSAILKRGRGSVLAAVRQFTRAQLDARIAMG